MTGRGRYYTLEETCEVLGVSRWTVYRRVREGTLTQFKTRHGGYNRYLRTEVHALKNEQYSNRIDDEGEGE